MRIFRIGFFMSKKLSFAALLLQNHSYITHALHFRCNLAAMLKSALTRIFHRAIISLPRRCGRYFFERLEESKCLI